VTVYDFRALIEPHFVADLNRVKMTVVTRTWRERLFKWPWRSWIATTTLTVPSTDLTYDPDTRTYYGHPATLKVFQKVWKENGLRRNS
jgi:hypothetical protein